MIGGVAKMTRTSLCLGISMPTLIHAPSKRLQGTMRNLVLVATALVSLQTAAATAQDGRMALTTRLSETATARMQADGVAGAAIVVLQGGGPVWTGAFGIADPERGLPVREDTLFRVESLSKPVTAWGAMRLVEMGLLDLDAPVTDCLRRWRPPEGTPTLTMRQLLSHRAGVDLGDFTERYDPLEERPVLPDHLARDFAIIATPGTEFAYSDTGFNILELMIEDCTGEDFGAFIGREVLAPLGMTTATYEWPGTGMAVGHDLRGRPVAAYTYPGRGSGGLLATAGDMARFAAASMAGGEQTVLSAEGLAQLHRQVAPVDGLFGFAADGYALGHFTETVSDGRHAVWHGGQGYGWMSHMHLVPDTGDGIVILSNSQRAWPLFAALLRDWSDNLGFAPAGMARVVWAETAARVTIGGLVALSALVAWFAWRRRPLFTVVRLLAGGSAAALILWPVWAAGQDYLFLFSILPGLWPWLGAASVLAGLTMAALSIVPERSR
jgi:CubicO group peptidase (beta-lactamase class C family)